MLREKLGGGGAGAPSQCNVMIIHFTFLQMFVSSTCSVSDSIIGVNLKHLSFYMYVQRFIRDCVCFSFILYLTRVKFKQSCLQIHVYVSIFNTCNVHVYYMLICVPLKQYELKIIFMLKFFYVNVFFYYSELLAIFSG